MRLDAGGTGGQGTLREVSASGAFIDTAVKLPVVTNLVVAVPAKGDALRAPAELAACVERSEASGLAVEWRDMACDALMALLGKSRGQPAPCHVRDPAFNR